MVDGGTGGLQSNERTEMGRVEMEKVDLSACTVLGCLPSSLAG